MENKESVNCSACEALKMRLMLIHCVNSECMSMIRRVPAATTEDQQLKDLLINNIQQICKYTSEYSPIFGGAEALCQNTKKSTA